MEKEKSKILEMLDIIEESYYSDKELYDIIFEGLKKVTDKLKEIKKFKK